MSTDALREVTGSTVEGVSSIALPFIGPNRILVSLTSGRMVEFSAIEIDIGPYETYELAVRLIDGPLTGMAVEPTHFRVSTVHLLEREEWIELHEAQDSPRPLLDTVGSNPVRQEYGPIGSSPAQVAYRHRVCFSVIFLSEENREEFLIRVSDYPGILEFVKSRTDIREIIQRYGVSKSYLEIK